MGQRSSGAPSGSMPPPGLPGDAAAASEVYRLAPGEPQRQVGGVGTDADDRFCSHYLA